jgi:hypothetical protein
LDLCDPEEPVENLVVTCWYLLAEGDADLCGDNILVGELKRFEGCSQYSGKTIIVSAFIS